MHVIITGGSLIGLMHGIMLKHHGWDVEILEQTLERLEGQAAGLSTGANLHQFLVRHDRIDRKLTLATNGLQVVDTNEQVINKVPLPMAMTTWDVLWFRLRANFDGLASVFEPEAAITKPDDGTATYHHGRRLVSVAGRGDSGVDVVYEDVTTGQMHTVHTDMLIAADGANSKVRSLLSPEAKGRQYAGYVLWRGIVPMSGLKQETTRLFNEWFSFCTIPQNREYICLYPVPGKTGGLEVKGREMNFAWYSKITSNDLAEALIGVDGHKHNWSVAQGKLKPTAWQKQLRQKGKTLNNAASDIVAIIDRPFLQVIGDHLAPKAAFHEGRVLIVGDALCTIRPHTGLGVSNGASHALELEKILSEGSYSVENHAKCMRKWETAVLDSSYMEYLKSICWGEYYLGSWFTWLIAASNYHGRVKMRALQAWAASLF